jgi:hypothetical protein
MPRTDPKTLLVGVEDHKKTSAGVGRRRRPPSGLPAPDDSGGEPARDRVADDSRVLPRARARTRGWLQTTTVEFELVADLVCQI